MPSDTEVVTSEPFEIDIPVRAVKLTERGLVLVMDPLILPPGVRLGPVLYVTNREEKGDE